MNVKLLAACALVAAVIAAAISFWFAFVSAPEAGSRALDGHDECAAVSELRARLKTMSEQLARLEARADVLGSPVSPLPSSRTELEPTPAIEAPICDVHCEPLRQQLEALASRFEALENHVRFGAPLAESKNVTQAKRAWGPEQATGAPNSGVGDQSNAWASLSEDDQDEWLLLTYEREVRATGLKVYENYKPGALARVTIFTADGSEIEVWRGQDPTSPEQQSGVSTISFSAQYWTYRVKLYLDSSRVSGWNEIDAVGLVDDAGRTSWAKGAEASSTYASRSTGDAVMATQELLQFQQAVNAIKWNTSR